MRADTNILTKSLAGELRMQPDYKTAKGNDP